MFKPPCIFLFYIDKLTDCTNDHEKAGNDVISILTCEGREDMENSPLGNSDIVWYNFYKWM